MRKRNTAVQVLTCACCAGVAYGRQYFNQDLGYGLCNDCADRFSDAKVNGQVDRAYGERGHHFGLQLWTCVDCGEKTPQFHRCKECSDSDTYLNRFGGEVPAGVDW